MCFIIEFMGWPRMQWAGPRATRWGRPNLMCNVMEKMLKTTQIDGMGVKTHYSGQKM